MKSEYFKMILGFCQYIHLYSKNEQFFEIWRTKMLFMKGNCIILCRYLYIQKKKKQCSTSYDSFFTIAYICTSTLWYFSINGERTYLQVISQNKSITIPIHSGPGVTYSQIGELRVGDIITTLASENDWVKHDKSGWSCQYHDDTKVLRPYTSHKDVN